MSDDLPGKTAQAVPHDRVRIAEGVDATVIPPPGAYCAYGALGAYTAPGAPGAYGPPGAYAGFGGGVAQTVMPGPRSPVAAA